MSFHFILFVTSEKQILNYTAFAKAMEKVKKREHKIREDNPPTINLYLPVFIYNSYLYEKINTYRQNTNEFVFVLFSFLCFALLLFYFCFSFIKQLLLFVMISKCVVRLVCLLQRQQQTFNELLCIYE